MPLAIPNLDNRRYQDLLDEALSRIPVHNPEWTNFNKSDPGVTLIEVFAFLAETILYRTNQVPERNRLKFLSLLGVPLRPASPARGIVAFRNERGELKTLTVNSGVEALAGKIPFRTEMGLDILPVEGRVYYKRPRPDRTAETLAYYRQLYASALSPAGTDDLVLYDTVEMTSPGKPLDLAVDTVGGAVWLALLARPNETDFAAIRQAIAGKVLNLGMVPALTDSGQQLIPASKASSPGVSLLDFAMPKIGDSGGLGADRKPQYRSIDATSTDDIFAEPGIVQLTLPSRPADLQLWNDVDPLEEGLDEFPPALQDSKISERIVTWVRVRSSAAARFRLLWLGINAVTATQRAHVSDESLPPGTGEPDQQATLSQRPVLAGSVTVRVAGGNWDEIDDLLSAPPEAPAPDLRLPPGTAQPPPGKPQVFALDPEAGVVKFGDGLRGMRPPAGAAMFAGYDYSVGAAGNVAAAAITAAPSLPAGFKVSNPVRTWGGADAEAVDEGEKQVSRFLRHRDRLVTQEDFETIVWRTPGVDLGRVDVLPAYHPELGSSQPGDAAGVVTVLVIPTYDPDQPDAPLPDSNFVNAICDYLDPRRLITTEVYLRGPVYKPVWISAGIAVEAGASIAETREAVRSALTAFLSPFQWPLRKTLLQAELVAVASRVPHVQLVSSLLLAEDAGPNVAQVSITGLELPRVLGISVVSGDAVDIPQLRGDATPGAAPRRTVPVPAIPEGC